MGSTLAVIAFFHHADLAIFYLKCPVIERRMHKMEPAKLKIWFKLVFP